MLFSPSLHVDELRSEMRTQMLHVKQGVCTEKQIHLNNLSKLVSFSLALKQPEAPPSATVKSSHLVYQVSTKTTTSFFSGQNPRSSKENAATCLSTSRMNIVSRADAFFHCRTQKQSPRFMLHSFWVAHLIHKSVDLSTKISHITQTQVFHMLLHPLLDDSLIMTALGLQQKTLTVQCTHYLRRHLFDQQLIIVFLGEVSGDFSWIDTYIILRIILEANFRAYQRVGK